MDHRIDRLIRAAQILAIDSVREVDFNDDLGLVTAHNTNWSHVGEQLWDDLSLVDLLREANMEAISGDDLAIARGEYIAECEAYGRGFSDDYADEYENAYA